MRKIRLWLIFFILAGWGQALPAQNRTLSGSVAAASDRTPLPGVNVVVKGGGSGTITDRDGRFTFANVSDDATLVFSFIGYQSQEVPVGGRSVLEVLLSESQTELAEVVVTALGFKEEADKLALTSSRIKGDQVAASGEKGIIDGLAGKASGLQISRQSSEPGAGSFIQIRGLNTITGNSQPLIIVDGIPISNSLHGNGISFPIQQSRLNDINPNDIESVQVLKGASAAALWGSRAANGVIVITTKSGSKDKFSAVFSTSLSLDDINVPYHPRQTTYGQGAGGQYSATATNSWGDRITDRAGGEDEYNTGGSFFVGESGKIYYPIVKKNSKDVFVEDGLDRVFRTGVSWDHNLSLSGGNEKSSYYLSLGDLSQRGILNGNSDYQRSSFKLNTDRSFTDYFKVSTHSAFTKISSDRQGRGNRTSGSPAALLRSPPDFDHYDYKGDYYASASASPIVNRQRSYRSHIGNVPRPAIGNPLWALNEQVYNTKVNRFINSIEAGLKPASWFDLTLRAGYDFSTDERLEYFPVNDYANNGLGQFTEAVYKESEWTTDIIGRITKDIGDHFSLNWVGGFSVNDRQLYYNGTTVNNFIIANAPPTFSNATAENRIPVNEKSQFRTARAYTTVGFSGWNSLFVNASIAGEAGSAFGEKANNNFYYPSADIAWQFSQLDLLQSSPVLSFGKLRASFGVVGVQPLPYKTITTFEVPSFEQQSGDYLYGSLYGNGAFLQSSDQGNDQLRPERKTEYEIGTDLRFFNNRLKGSFTYYFNTVKDILIPLALPASTGFVTRYSNAASLQNHGIEADLGFDLLTRSNWRWSLNANFSRIRNRVTSLSGTGYVVTTETAMIDPVAVVGQPVGVMWGAKFERNTDGSLLLDENQFPVLAAEQGVVGDPNPSFTGGLGSSLSYRKFSLDVLFETSRGGDFYEGTRAIMYNFGTHAETGNDVKLTNDTKNYAGSVIPAGSTVRGILHNFGGGEVLLDESYYTSLGGGFSSLREPWISDGSWTRLRQLSLGYRLDSPGFRKATRLSAIDISLAGRNLWVWSKIKGIDPDINTGGAMLARSQDYFNTPNTRSWIFSLRFTY